MSSVKKKYHIIQLGCASNQADGIKMANNLIFDNSELTSKIEEANVIIVMSCGFSKKQYQESIDRIWQANKHKNKKAEIWVGGCVPSINRDFHSEFSFRIHRCFNPRNIGSFFRNSFAYNQTKRIEIITLLNLRLKSFPIRIENGCTEKCRYCVIKKAGGKTKSKLISELIHEIQVLDENIGSICLVGEEIGSFGKDTGEQLLDLITEVIKIKPKINITFSAIHPKFFIQDYDQYKTIFSYKNIIPILPIPIQSGSNKVLKLMRRDYLIEDVMSKLSNFMNFVPHVRLSSDIMVGFPGENWEDFLQTQQIVNGLPLSALDCFKYDDMNNNGDIVNEKEKIKRLKIIALTFIRNYFKQKKINNSEELENFLSSNNIPINLNF